jgi:DNA-binding protein HU-beta
MVEVKESVTNNQSVFLRGFGTFKPKKRAEKTGRNISKNTTIIIPAHHIPAFKPAKVFVKQVKESIK